MTRIGMVNMRHTLQEREWLAEEQDKEAARRRALKQEWNEAKRLLEMLMVDDPDWSRWFDENIQAHDTMTEAMRKMGARIIWLAGEREKRRAHAFIMQVTPAFFHLGA